MSHHVICKHNAFFFNEIFFILKEGYCFPQSFAECSKYKRFQMFVVVDNILHWLPVFCFKMQIVLMYIFLFLAFIVQTGLFDPDLVHSSHPDIWWKQIPQPFQSQVVSSFSLHTSTHHSLHRAGDQVYPHPAMYRQDPHTDPPGLGKELQIL